MIDSLTIIVPTRNEAANIGGFLASIPPAVKLIVVDASDDETPTLVRQLRPKNTIVVQRPLNVTEARQAGAGLAHTEWLLFTDADVVFSPDYFTLLPTHLFGGCVYGAKLSTDGYQGYYHWFTRGQALIHKTGIPAASGSNLLLRRTVFNAIGGFDLDLTCNEDSEIAWRAQKMGYPVHFAPQLKVYARDHRRLERGVWRKTWHSLARCTLLYLNVLPDSWRQHDWGYWQNVNREGGKS